jgi:elongation factor G
MPQPTHALIEISVAASCPADRGKVVAALDRLCSVDRTLHVSWKESSTATLGGSSEAQLDHAVASLAAERIAVVLSAPQVVYRETLGRRAEIDHTHKKQTGGSGQFARVKIIFEPVEPGRGYSFKSEVRGGNVPDEFVAGVEKGLASVRENGLLAGFPVIDFKATLTDGAYHDRDSSVLAFETAAREAFQALREKGSPRLLEPTMNVEVTTPEDCVGDVMADFISRRGAPEIADQRDDAQVVIASVPLANLLGYANVLRSMTRGRAIFQMDFARYDVVPLPGPPDDAFPPAVGMRT